MRNLVILRGAPGCGKSTWIKENGLEPWTLSSDDIRLSIASPVLGEDGKLCIPQNNEKTWNLLFSLLEERMNSGEFVIVDATHSKIDELSTYNKLCKEYHYRKFYVQFDTPVDTCLKQNLLRPEYKQVPEKSIIKISERIKSCPMKEGWIRLDQNDIWKTLDYRIADYNQYEKVVLFGDIHGCVEPLKEYFEKNPFDEKTLYIFVGDYLDRGIQNKETLELILQISKNPNTLFLEGNHERWLRLFSIEDYGRIKSKEFRDSTFSQIMEINKSEIREFCRHLCQIAYFEFGGNRYLVTHGGLNIMPQHLPLISTNQLIKGVGTYGTDIDELWKQSSTGIIQIHGHRNLNEENVGNESSINLEGKIEFGGHLRVYTITKNSSELSLYKNDVYKKLETSDFQKSNLIKEKDLGNGISSFNFTKDAFISGEWNELTCKARGLFMDTKTNKVVARGYEKFFNINEVPETRLDNLEKKLQGPITCYKKENGFLGILSYVNGELMFCSKSTNTGDFANYFKTIYEESEIDKEAVKNFLKDGWFSLVFEVIDIKNDPHIIEYDKSKIVLLDAIVNKLDFERLPYTKLIELSETFNCEVKSVYKEFSNFSEFKNWLENLKTENLTDIEGVVVESSSYMCKLKFEYYLFWKHMRSIVESLNKYGKVKKEPESEKGLTFYHWLQKNPELLSKDIITLRKMFEKGE